VLYLGVGIYLAIAIFKFILMVYRLPLAFHMMDYLEKERINRVVAYMVSVPYAVVFSLLWPIAMKHEGTRFFTLTPEREMFESMYRKSKGG